MLRLLEGEVVEISTIGRPEKPSMTWMESLRRIYPLSNSIQLWASQPLPWTEIRPLQLFSLPLSTIYLGNSKGREWCSISKVFSFSPPNFPKEIMMAFLSSTYHLKKRIQASILQMSHENRAFCQTAKITKIASLIEYRQQQGNKAHLRRLPFSRFALIRRIINQIQQLLLLRRWVES